MLKIEAKGLVKAFGSTTALAGVDVHLEPGAVTLIEGDNGSGKSTLLQVLGLMMRPTRGVVHYNDQSMSPGDHARANIGFVGHQGWLYPELSGRENLKLVADLYALTDASERIEAQIETMRLQSFCDRPVQTYSRGQKQRTAVARSLLPDPSVLLLDEPTTGLDDKSIKDFSAVLQEQRNAGKTLAIVTHDSAWGRAMADTSIRLHDGKIVSSL